MYALQRYIEEAFDLSNQKPTPVGEYKFEDIIEVYNTVTSNAKYWKEELFPSTVSLTGNVRDYADYVDTYYEGLKKAASEKNSQEIKKILTGLLFKAKKHLASAQKVFNDLNSFQSKLTTNCNNTCSYQSNWKCYPSI